MSKFVYILEGHQSVSEFDTREAALEAAKTGLLIGAHHMRLQHPFHDADALRLQRALLGERPRIDWDGIAIVIFTVAAVALAAWLL